MKKVSIGIAIVIVAILIGIKIFFTLWPDKPSPDGFRNQNAATQQP